MGEWWEKMMDEECVVAEDGNVRLGFCKVFLLHGFFLNSLRLILFF